MSGPRPRVDALVELELGRVKNELATEFLKVINSPNFERDCMTRYRIGQAQYKFKYEWLNWARIVFKGERYTEVLDDGIYLAMERVAAAMAEAEGRSIGE